MAKRNGTARAEVDEDLPKHFSFRPVPELNVRLRHYLIDNGVSFQEICEPAILDFLTKHPRFPRKSLRLPRGRRPKLT